MPPINVGVKSLLRSPTSKNLEKSVWYIDKENEIPEISEEEEEKISETVTRNRLPSKFGIKSLLRSHTTRDNRKSVWYTETANDKSSSKAKSTNDTLSKTKSVVRRKPLCYIEEFRNQILNSQE